MKPFSAARSYWPPVLMAGSILMVIMGARQSQGLFVSPLNTSTGVGIASISLAIAVGHFIWGATQPIAGAIADRWGPGRVLAAGVFASSLGLALTPLATSTTGLVLTLGIIAAAGAGAASFAVLIGAVGRYVPMEKRGIAAGVINAGNSFGQFVFAPLTQFLITVSNWMFAMWFLALSALALLPLTWMLRKHRATDADVATPEESTPDQSHAANMGLGATVARALADRSYLLLHAGFFTCGFHIAFLATHLPGEVQLCGQSAQVAGWALSIIGATNVLGSLVAGWCTQTCRSKYLLFWMYGSRTVLILIYLAAPKTTLTFYLFAAGLGLTWLATVPPTAAIVGKLFGGRYLSTLFGLTLLSHQIGGFLGAWLGGITIEQFGDYRLMWYIDAGLAAAAAFVNLPIREARINPLMKAV